MYTTFLSSNELYSALFNLVGMGAFIFLLVFMIFNIIRGMVGKEAQQRIEMQDMDISPDMIFNQYVNWGSGKPGPSWAGD